MKPHYTRPGDPSNRASDRNDLVRELDRLDRRITEGQIWNHPEGDGGVAVLNLQITDGTEVGKYQITDGTVNTQTPTLGGVEISGDPDADPVVLPPEFTVTATTYVWIKVVGVFASPDTYTITIETPTTSAPPTEAVSASGFTSYHLVGYVTFTSGSPDTYSITNDHSGGNLGIESFGGVNLWWIK